MFTRAPRRRLPLASLVAALALLGLLLFSQPAAPSGIFGLGSIFGKNSGTRELAEAPVPVANATPTSTNIELPEGCALVPQAFSKIVNDAVQAKVRAQAKKCPFRSDSHTTRMLLNKDETGQVSKTGTSVVMMNQTVLNMSAHSFQIATCWGDKSVWGVAVPNLIGYGAKATTATAGFIGKATSGFLGGLFGTSSKQRGAVPAEPLQPARQVETGGESDEADESWGSYFGSFFGGSASPPPAPPPSPQPSPPPKWGNSFTIGFDLGKLGKNRLPDFLVARGYGLRQTVQMAYVIEQDLPFLGTKELTHGNATLTMEGFLMFDDIDYDDLKAPIGSCWGMFGLVEASFTAPFLGLSDSIMGDTNSPVEGFAEDLCYGPTYWDASFGPKPEGYIDMVNNAVHGSLYLLAPFTGAFSGAFIHNGRDPGTARG